MKFFEKQTASPDTFSIAKKITVSGNIEGAVSGRIEGLIHGDINVKGKIIIAESGVVMGSIRGIEVTVFGKVRGDVMAEKSVIVSAHGEVGGNIASIGINIDAEAQVGGNIRKLNEGEELEFAELSTTIVDKDGLQTDNSKGIKVLIREYSRTGNSSSQTISPDRKDHWW